MRSVTTDAESPPHTGATRYEEGGPRIPAAAVSIPVAERLAALVEAGDHPRVRLEMQAHDGGMRTSHNVVAELRGESYAPARHELGMEIKAVTYHQLKIARDGSTWAGRVILDI